MTEQSIERLYALAEHARTVNGRADDDPWRCAVYLSANSWYDDGIDGADRLAAQSAACKAKLRRLRTVKKAATYRERNTGAKADIEFRKLQADIENRRIDCVMVADLSGLPYCYAYAANYLREVIFPCGFRFIDIALDFDSLHGNPKDYLRALDHRNRSFWRYYHDALRAEKEVSHG